MAYRNYQTHDAESKGMSDSARKLERLHWPADFEGKSFLDIGCNEGFFCATAIRRGAGRVVGIDYSKPALDFGREKYEDLGIEFIQSTWRNLPPGPFDVVQWSSAMHYELDPKFVFDNVLDRLAPDGLFILECGVFDWPNKEMAPAHRHSDTRWYPTLALLTEMLSGFSVRRVAQPEIAEGDPVPRSVFHCTPRRLTVMLIRGSTRVGKSTLSELLSPSATKSISLDNLVSRSAMAKYHHSKLEKFIHEKYNPASLGAIYYDIDQNGLTEEFASFIANSIAPTDKFVTVDGPLSNAQVFALVTKLPKNTLIWSAERSR